MAPAHKHIAALITLLSVFPSSVLGVALYGQCGGIGWTVSEILLYRRQLPNYTNPF